jgi:hypothetical protein
MSTEATVASAFHLDNMTHFNRQDAAEVCLVPLI